MKKVSYILVLLAAASLIVSCGEKKDDKEKDMTEETESTEEEVKEEKTSEKESFDWRAKQEELAGMTPLTKEEIGAWYPKTLLGLPATNEQTTVTDEMAIFTITYYANKQRINLNVMDGAGKRGAQITAPAHMIAIQEVDEESDYGYTKTVTKNGIIARESHIQKNNTHNLDFFYKERLYVKLKVMNLSAEKAWEAVDELNLEKLAEY